MLRSSFENNLNETTFRRQLLRYLETYGHDNVFIPDDFWQPVRICLSKSQIENIPDIITHGEEECVICSNKREKFKQINCCKNNICSDCVTKWFNESVKCPYCKQDLRTYLN
jgi:hypothetical protein